MTERRGGEKYIRHSLSILFLLPLCVVFTRVNLIADVVVGLFFVVIPLIGLRSGKLWFFYYVYVAVPIALGILIFTAWFISLFGDQSYSFVAIAVRLWPILLYSGAIIVLTATVQKYRGFGGEQGEP